MLLTLNLINVSASRNVKEYLDEENYIRVTSCNSKIDKFTAIRDCLEVGGNVLQQTGLACFTIGNAEWFKSSPTFGPLNLIFYGSVAAVAQAFCFGIAKFCDSEIIKTKCLVKELLADQKAPCKSKSA